MTAPAPMLLQADFHAALFGVLISRSAAAVLLGMSTDHVTRMCEEGSLVSYNIAVAEQDRRAAVADRSAERMLRIVRASVTRHTCIRLASVPDANFSPAALCDSIHRRTTWFCREVAALFDSSEQHVLNLRHAGLLAGPQLTTSGSGRGSFVSRESLIAFLTGRAL